MVFVHIDACKQLKLLTIKIMLLHREKKDKNILGLFNKNLMGGFEGTLYKISTGVKCVKTLSTIGMGMDWTTLYIN